METFRSIIPTESLNHQPFLKAGADAPETLLAYADFDDTLALKKEVPLKNFAPHVTDWRAGDPTWKGGKGKGLIGALNYLSAKGANAVSFLTYNAAGDGDNVWPFVARDEKFHYDCSRLDQWGIVFDHAQARGVFLHFKLQENENDDDRIGPQRKPGRVVESLDGGACGPERRLYLRDPLFECGVVSPVFLRRREAYIDQGLRKQRYPAQILGQRSP